MVTSRFSRERPNTTAEIAATPTSAGNATRNTFVECFIIFASSTRLRPA
jgi:hypothetical protein